LYPESGGEPFGLLGWQVWSALDLSTTIDDEARSRGLKEVATSIVEIVDATTTFAQLQQMAASDRVRGFVRKDARDLLKSRA
jgi:uncharacterized ferredoxin-like protein